MPGGILEVSLCGGHRLFCGYLDDPSSVCRSPRDPDICPGCIPGAGDNAGAGDRDSVFLLWL